MGIVPSGRLTAWSLALLYLTPLPCAAAPEPLSLRQAQRLAELRSLALPAQAEAARAARERAVAAGQRPDPVLRLGLDNVPVEGGADSLLTREPSTARSIGLVQALPGAQKREARSLVFEREAELALAQRAVARRELRRNVALAWVMLQAETMRLRQIASQRVEAERLRDSVDAAWRAGRGLPADPFIARAALVRLDDQGLQAEGRLAVARAEWARWVGDVAMAPSTAATEPLPWHVLPPSPVPDDDPEMLLAAAREASAGAAVALASADRQTDWSVDLRFQQRGPRFDNMVTLGLSIPLRWDLANRQDRELAARQAQQRQTEAETEELRRQRDAELARWRARWHTAMQRLALLDSDLLPLAAARTEAALAAYRAGTGTLPAVLDARTAEAALHTDRVQLELEAATEWVRLDALIPPPETTP